MAVVDGVRYECDGCGECCRQLIIEVAEVDLIREPRLIPHVEPFRCPPGFVLADDDGEEVEEQVPGYGGGGNLACGEGKPCGLLSPPGPDGRRGCTVYPTRPGACVYMPAGGEQCQRSRLMAGLARLRPAGPLSLPVIPTPDDPPDKEAA
jgi:Fe-S-cluster containining protein